VKIKLDENMGKCGQEILRDAGYNVATVYEQKMGGASDDKLFRLCSEEGLA